MSLDKEYWKQRIGRKVRAVLLYDTRMYEGVLHDLCNCDVEEPTHGHLVLPNGRITALVDLSTATLLEEESQQMDLFK